MTAFLLSGCSIAGWKRAIQTRENITVSTGSRSIENARALPPRGKGYSTYHSLGGALGRQYADHRVIETLQATFRTLREETGRRHIVSEIGDVDGGKFYPHASHQKGLSVDISTPLKRLKSDRRSRIPTGIFGLFGYCWKIDPDTHRVWGLEWEADHREPCLSLHPVKNDAHRSMQIPLRREVDFDALRDLVLQLHEQASAHGLKVADIIVADSFLPFLKGIPKVRGGSWTRHDDHIHVEFVYSR
jgi:penicillin-insensitive murein endopeptidase